MQQAIADLKRRALASGQMFEPVSTEINPARTVETVSISLAGNGGDGQSVAALRTLRDRVIPASVGTRLGRQAAVTGETAGTHDFNQQMKSHAPLVFAFVLALCFLLLLVTFRSIVIPIKAVLLNLLSVGAAYGLLVLVFQHRFAEGILGFHSNGAITSWLPLFMFVILFGLSMDYHVFILSRIKELVDGGMPTEQAVATGIKRTAGTVTSAAVVMVAVFAIFVTLRTLDIKQMGFGLAAAILIDSTVVRAVLLPAVMKLLGDWNWYLPRRLEWLPRLDAGRWAQPRIPARRAHARRAARLGVRIMCRGRGFRRGHAGAPGAARRARGRLGGSCVVDDHASFRRCASELLTAEGFDVVGEARGRCRCARARGQELEPELVLLDIQLPDTRRLRCRRAAARAPSGTADRARLEPRPLGLRAVDRDERGLGLHLQGRSSQAKRSRGCWSDGRVSSAERGRCRPERATC